MTYTIGSLCTGVDMFGLAADQHHPDAQRLWHAETDPAASRILTYHQPAAPNCDITGGAPDGCSDEIMRRHARRKWRDAPRVDEVHSTHPCQGNSHAGRRKGAADERNLWPAVVGCLDIQQPPVVVVENVPGLLDIDQGVLFGRMLTDLHRLGYTARWTTVGACRTGACHHRHRVFLRATLDRQPTPGREPSVWLHRDRWVAAAGGLLAELDRLRRFEATVGAAAAPHLTDQPT